MENILDNRIDVRILELPEEMSVVEELQRIIWPGSETEIVPVHLLLTVSHNGGLVIGAIVTEIIEPGFEKQNNKHGIHLPRLPSGEYLVGFVFGFPGIDDRLRGRGLRHCSHMLGVHPNYQNRGIGYRLKRAQWQLVRHQGIERVTWTFDPLLSRNAYLNISRLGAVCNTYQRDAYGDLRDGLNAGLATDRFQVDWWLNSRRVFLRLSKHPRVQLDLAHYLSAGTEIVNPTQVNTSGLALPAPDQNAGEWQERIDRRALFLVEIPAEFHGLKRASIELAQTWRMHTRNLFEAMFSNGYLVTDFVYLRGKFPRSYYVMSYGESTL